VEKTIKYWIFICVIIACTIFLCFKQLKDNNWNRCISSDGKGYYAYLPAIFIYHDLQFQFVEQYETKYYNEENKVDFTNDINNAQVNKYWMGAAVLMSPFFFLAHGLASLFDFKSDGYSFIYQMMIAVAAVFYLLLGLYFMRKLLLLYFCSDFEIFIASFAIVFATNLFYYTVAEPSISHVYSFASICTFVYFVKKYFNTFNIKCFKIAILLLAVILLIRPSNFIVLLSLPFMAGSFNNFKLSFKNNKLFMIIPSLVIAALILSFQFIYYKQVAGSFFVYSYGIEKFNFFDPHYFDFLFSYRRGVFVYAPILLVALLGFYNMSQKSSFQAKSLGVFLIIVVYILSSWWMWYYGGGFGMRPMIDFYVFFTIPLALLIQRWNKNKWFKMIGLFTITACIIVAQIQTYQKVNFILPWDGINKEIYWKIFLKTNPTYIGKYTGDAHAQ